MTELVATMSGCRVFGDAGESMIGLAGRRICALAPDASGGALAVIDGTQIWHRSSAGEWSHSATSESELQSLELFRGTVFGGGATEAALVRVQGEVTQRLPGFDQCPG